MWGGVLLILIYLCNIFYIYAKKKKIFCGGEVWIKSLSTLITVLAFDFIFMSCFMTTYLVEYYL